MPAIARCQIADQAVYDPTESDEGRMLLRRVNGASWSFSDNNFLLGSSRLRKHRLDRIMVRRAGANDPRRTALQLGRIDNVIHPAMEREQAPPPVPRRRVTVELRQGVRHSLPLQPGDDAAVLTGVEVARDQSGQVRCAVAVKQFHLAHPIVAGGEITADPASAVADGRAQMHVQHLH